MYKTVLITGASRGIGRAIACAFAREGCRLVINCSRSEKELLALADELRETCHVDVLTSIGDVSDYAYMEQLFSQSEARFGGGAAGPAARALRLYQVIPSAAGPPAPTAGTHAPGRTSRTASAGNSPAPRYTWPAG